MTAKFLISVAAIAFTAALTTPPASAIDLSVGADADIGADVGASIGGDDGDAGVDAGASLAATVNAGLGAEGGGGGGIGGSVGGGGQGSVVGGAAADLNGAVGLAAAAAASASAFLNATVTTAEGEIVGVVSDVTAAADGTAVLVVSLADDFIASVDSFSLSASGHAAVDGEVHLGATEAELRAAIEASSTARATLN